MITISLVNLLYRHEENGEDLLLQTCSTQDELHLRIPRIQFPVTEVSFGTAVKEKLPEELYPCFRRYEGINHRVRLGLMSNKFTSLFRIMQIAGDINYGNLWLKAAGVRHEACGVVE